MILRTLVLILGGALTTWPGSASALASPADLAPPATRSALDPVRLAADFAPAPAAPSAPDIEPFELAAFDSTSSPADSLAPAVSDTVSSPPILPAGPIMGAQEPPIEQPPIVAPIVGALVGGAMGVFGGGALGYAAIGGYESAHSGDIEDLGAIFLGASLGDLFLMPAGAHLGNAGKGSYWSALGGSALGYVATVAFSFAGPIGTACGLALQTALTVTGERLSAKRRADERALESGTP
jgi:hypothetical protein